MVHPVHLEVSINNILNVRLTFRGNPLLCTYQCIAPPALGWAKVGIRWGFAKMYGYCPTPWANFKGESPAQMDKKTQGEPAELTSWPAVQGSPRAHAQYKR
jgi:hypothetical protein